MYSQDIAANGTNLEVTKAAQTHLDIYKYAEAVLSTYISQPKSLKKHLKFIAIELCPLSYIRAILFTTERRTFKHTVQYSPERNKYFGNYLRASITPYKHVILYFSWDTSHLHSKTKNDFDNQTSMGGLRVSLSECSFLKACKTFLFPKWEMYSGGSHAPLGVDVIPGIHESFLRNCFAGFL